MPEGGEAVRPELARALAAAHIHRDEARFQAVIREIIVNEPSPTEVEKWRAMLARKAEADAKPKPATLLGGALILVTPAPLDAVVLDDDVRASVDRWIRELRWREALAARGIPSRIGGIFHGATGTGKTMLAGAIAGALELPCYSVRTSEVVGKHVGEGPKAVARVIDQARKVPMVVVFDEVDSVGGSREDSDDSSAAEESRRTTNAFLQELDQGVGTSIVIGTTNLFSRIDSAFARRLPFRLAFPEPTRSQVAAFMTRVAARHGIERFYGFGADHIPTSYAEAEHEALCDVRDAIITELEAAT